MTDIVVKLRRAAKFGGHYAEAADVIESLRAKNDELIGVLSSSDDVPPISWVETLLWAFENTAPAHDDEDPDATSTMISEVRSFLERAKAAIAAHS